MKISITAMHGGYVVRCDPSGGGFSFERIIVDKADALDFVRGLLTPEPPPMLEMKDIKLNPWDIL